MEWQRENMATSCILKSFDLINYSFFAKILTTLKQTSTCCWYPAFSLKQKQTVGCFVCTKNLCLPLKTFWTEFLVELLKRKMNKKFPLQIFQEPFWVKARSKHDHHKNISNKLPLTQVLNYSILWLLYISLNGLRLFQFM